MKFEYLETYEEIFQEALSRLKAQFAIKISSLNKC